MSKKTRRTLSNVLLGLCIALFLFSLFMLGRELLQRKADSNRFRNLAQRTLLDPDATAPGAAADPEDPLATGSGTGAIHRRNMASLIQENADSAAWVQIRGTSINYPVMHTPTEPQKYLRRDFYGDYSAGGTPFLDDGETLDCDNLIVYGHHMQTGELFSDLLNYEEQDYWKEHPLVEFETAEGWAQYRIFAAAPVQEEDDWYSFHWATDPETFSQSVAELLDAALYDTGIRPEYGQQLLTLSTCYHYWTSDQRFIIVAVRED